MYRVNGLNDRKRARTSCRLATGPLLLAVGLVLCPDALSAQSVVSDGTTATNISIGVTGHVTVDIAPADSAAISHNSYSSFSVPSAGVDLNNTSAGANTIVNEVTSTNVTTIEGPLTVIGQQADVIIANPNGIAVNGGRFLNTGNVALTTGTLGRDGADKIVSTVASGAIDVGPGGLSGAMEELALISKSLRVNGPIQVDPALNGRSHANIITGDSTVNFDRARGGFGQDGAGLLPWALATDRGHTSTEAVIVDITQSGSLNAGRISMTVCLRPRHGAGGSNGQYRVWLFCTVGQDNPQRGACHPAGRSERAERRRHPSLSRAYCEAVLIWLLWGSRRSRCTCPAHIAS